MIAVDWKKLLASVIWISGVGALDIAYMRGHGVDLTAIVTSMFALAPTWAYIGKDVSFSFFGQKLDIKGSEVALAAAEVVRTAPAAVARAQTLGQLSPRRNLQAWDSRHVLGNERRFFHLDLFDAEPAVINDPRQALIALRSEITVRVNRIATLLNMPIKCFTTDTVRTLKGKGIFPPAFADGMLDLIRFGNAAADGATITPDQMPKESDYAPVLGALDDIIDQLSKAQKADSVAE